MFKGAQSLLNPADPIPGALKFAVQPSDLIENHNNVGQSLIFNLLSACALNRGRRPRDPPLFAGFRVIYFQPADGLCFPIPLFDRFCVNPLPRFFFDHSGPREPGDERGVIRIVQDIERLSRAGFGKACGRDTNGIPDRVRGFIRRRSAELLAESLIPVSRKITDKTRLLLVGLVCREFVRRDSCHSKSRH
ncbi:MAG: hypothetical protein BWY42_00845 [Candidatus Omnitrophica bacterium ADurb.Bin277]|nr:MAG: hypothetical protein BWY42_00845 [Candidatus Omnitrophica bacterium ADurb.Bin277]